MVRAGASIAFLLVALGVGIACGGSLGEEQAPPPCDEGGIDAGLTDAIEDEAAPWWADVFGDANRFHGFDPPIPGEYPPNAGPCLQSGCFVNGTCDPETGWCCSGKMKKGACVCGHDAGCVPPSICCALPGALEYTCVATPDDCPGVRR